MERVNAYENLRGLVYTPFYLGLAEGLFRAAGVDLVAELSPSGAETAAGVAAGRVDVSWGGPMRVMAAHDKDPNADLVCFGLAVARDPFLVIGREADAHFAPAKLVGRRLAVATEAPTPWLLLQEDIRRAGLDPAAVVRDDPVAPDAALGRLAEEGYDYVLAFEPWASIAEAEGMGTVVSAGARRGPLAFTSFYAPAAFVAERRSAAEALVAGLAAALRRLHAMPAEDIAAAIQPWFPETPPAAAVASVARYKALGVWPDAPALTADGFVRLKNALISGGFIQGDPPYRDLTANF